MTPRPTSLKEVALQTESLADFGRNLRDWLHELRRLSSRPQLMCAIAEEPPSLQARFPQGNIADAWLAAYAEHLASRVNHSPPAWAFQKSRIVPEPWFADESGGPALRALALAHAPLAFKRRNLYTDAVDLPLRLRAGRPVKTAEEKRRVNAERQRRFRARRQAELAALRKIAARVGKSAVVARAL